MLDKELLYKFCSFLGNEAVTLQVWDSCKLTCFFHHPRPYLFWFSRISMYNPNGFKWPSKEISVFKRSLSVFQLKIENNQYCSEIWITTMQVQGWNSKGLTLELIGIRVLCPVIIKPDQLLALNRRLIPCLELPVVRRKLKWVCAPLVCLNFKLSEVLVWPNLEKGRSWNRLSISKFPSSYEVFSLIIGR